MKSIATFLLIVSAFALVPAKAGQETKETVSKPLVYVPVLPYEFLLEKLAGDWIEVHSIVQEGDDCHSYSPTPKQIVKLTKANLLFTGRLGFEANFFVASGDGKTGPLVVDLLDGLDLLEGTCEECLKGAEGHKHSHEDLKDPHVWLSPRMLRQQLPKIASVLKDFLPESGGKAVDKNLAAMLTELAAIEEEEREALAPLKGQKFYVYHGAFAYFAEDFGLEQVAIEMGNRQATPGAIVELAAKAKEDHVKLVFVQPQFDQSSSRALADAIGGEVVILDPLQKDVFEGLRKIANAVKMTQHP